jgi:ABC-type phosphate transport system substrate-binding protein
VARRVRRAVVFVVALASVVTSGARADELAIVVHRDRPEALDREAVAQIFLKRRSAWSDGSTIVPINRVAGSDVREAFDRALFGPSAAGRMLVYWNRAYFQGVLPPATLASSEAVLRFVAREPRAIGYVPSRDLDESVRVVLHLPVASPPESRAAP